MTGVWAASSMMFYSTMFAGMAGTPSADQFAAGDVSNADELGGADSGGEDLGGFGDFGDFGGGDGFDFF